MRAHPGLRMPIEYKIGNRGLRLGQNAGPAGDLVPFSNIGRIWLILQKLADDLANSQVLRNREQTGR